MTDETEDQAVIEDDAPEEGAAEETGAKPDAGGKGQNIDAMLNVGLNVQIVLGRTRMPIAQLLKLSRGSIIELDKRIGQPVEVVINDRLVARGDLVKLEDDRIGVSLIEIVKDYVTDE
ncbi:FliM/FliN family flagellar motor switch protein [Pseudooceanicola sp.]|jgi:flagellar motor switch protein FliN/FliY|uniref:FliM/FliN family flagellar motor switch protein n=1 Tax=Pseudooceanicola sp. TaxID=1914328 RepID=UPI0040589D32